MRRLVETDAHEGLVYVAEEDALYFTTSRPRVEIRRLDLARGRVKTVRAETGVANGMTLDHDGSLLVCEQQPAAITRVDRAGGFVETVVDSFGGVPLNSPNDIVVTRDGAIWFTDPSYAHLQGFGPEPQLPDAVYRYADGELAMVADGFEKPNGLAFSPDERVLYVGDSEACVIWAFEDGERRLFADIAPGYPDGLKVDGAGRVYSTAGDGIHIFDPAGRRAGAIAIPGAVNFAFGDEALFITTDDAIWRSTTDEPGYKIDAGRREAPGELRAAAGPGAADPLGPGDVPNRTYDVVPHAEAPEFDDSDSERVQRRILEAAERLTPGFPSGPLGGMTLLRRVGGRAMQLNAGTRVAVESESTERPARTGVIEEVLREAPSARYRIRWDDGHESIYTPAAGALRAVEAAERQ